MWSSYTEAASEAVRDKTFLFVTTHYTGFKNTEVQRATLRAKADIVKEVIERNFSETLRLEKNYFTQNNNICFTSDGNNEFAIGIEVRGSQLTAGLETFLLKHNLVPKERFIDTERNGVDTYEKLKACIDERKAKCPAR